VEASRLAQGGERPDPEERGPGGEEKRDDDRAAERRGGRPQADEPEKREKPHSA